MDELGIARQRFRIMCFGLGLLFLLLAGRLFDLQVVRYDVYAADARRYHETADIDPAPRGSVFDLHGEPLAVSTKTMTLTVDPIAVGPIVRKEGLADLLVELGIPFDREALLERLYRSSRYVVLERRIEDAARVERIRSTLRREGFHRAVRFEVEYKRAYPLGRDAVHVVGVLGELTDAGAEGLWGIERYFESILHGRDGRWDWERDAVGHRRFTGDAESVAVEPGADIHLTLDANLQSELVREMRQTMEENEAAGASGVLLDPRDGRILALASLPDFDPDNRGALTKTQIRNRAISSSLGPGSSFKPIIMAAALEAGVVNPQTAIETDDGQSRFGGRTIRDTHPHARLSATDILVHSSNIGMAKIAIRLGRERIYAFERALGFGQLSEIHLPFEEKGKLNPLAQWSRSDNYSTASHGFGQEIGVTPLQLALAYAVLANGGFKVAPRIVDKVVAPDGRVLRPPVAPPYRLLSERTGEWIREMTARVIEHPEGSNRKLAIPGYRTAGKTGTFEIMGAGREVLGHVATYVCFGPLPDPRIVAVIMVERPNPRRHFGGQVAGPAVQNVVRHSFEYLGLPRSAAAEPGPQ